MMNGGYVLLIENEKNSKIPIGGLGRIEFQRGFYAYVGSALNGVEARIKRHLCRKKKFHWHIDYLLKKTIIIGIFYIKTNKRIECKIAKNLSKRFKPIKKFGSSDCDCNSHLFFSTNFYDLEGIIINQIQNNR